MPNLGNNILDESDPSKCIILGDLKPFQIVSLLDMIQADVKELVGLIAGLVSVKKNLEDEAAELSDAGSKPKEIRVKLAENMGRASWRGWATPNVYAGSTA